VLGYSNQGLWPLRWRGHPALFTVTQAAVLTRAEPDGVQQPDRVTGAVLALLKRAADPKAMGGEAPGRDYRPRGRPAQHDAREGSGDSTHHGPLG